MKSWILIIGQIILVAVWYQDLHVRDAMFMSSVIVLSIRTIRLRDKSVIINDTTTQMWFIYVYTPVLVFLILTIPTINILVFMGKSL